MGRGEWANCIPIYFIIHEAALKKHHNLDEVYAWNLTSPSSVAANVVSEAVDKIKDKLTIYSGGLLTKTDHSTLFLSLCYLVAALYSAVTLKPITLVFQLKIKLCRAIFKFIADVRNK